MKWGSSKRKGIRIKDSQGNEGREWERWEMELEREMHVMPSAKMIIPQ